MSFRSSSRCVFLAGTIYACAPRSWPDPPPVDRAAFLAEHAVWRSQLQQAMGDHYAGLAGVWLVDEERTPFGTDSSLPIVLAGPGPRAVLGTFVRHGRAVQLEPTGSGRLFADDHRP